MRQSRDDSGKNLETIETQRDLLVEYAAGNRLGSITGIYWDDNVSGSTFDRGGLNRLREDVLAGKLDLVLLKDLSRLGRNNSKTLLFLDFLEEKGVRVITSDNRFDSWRDDDMLGIETWVNERYVRDISRKIRANIRFKIQKGEYLGQAPYGYRKASGEKNRLVPDSGKAENVRYIFRLYRQGYGYSTIASQLDSEGIPAPAGGHWNPAAVRRILCNRVYMGDTVQGVSERISFKNKKARRLPAESWVVTTGTHEPIIGREEYLEVQKLRESKHSFTGPLKKELHLLRGLAWCGRCGSAMVARKRKGSDIAYICGNYCRNGRKACSSHLLRERDVTEIIRREIRRLSEQYLSELLPEWPKEEEAFCRTGTRQAKSLQKQLQQKRKQKELLYMDRLEERVDLELFTRLDRELSRKVQRLEAELERLGRENGQIAGAEETVKFFEEPEFPLTHEMVRQLVDRILVFDPGDLPGGAAGSDGMVIPPEGVAVILFSSSDSPVTMKV